MRKIRIAGVIVCNDAKWVYDLFEIESFCPADLALQDGEEIEIEIASPGGSVDAASQIYTALKRHNGRSTGIIISRACSAASVIAMGVDTLKMTPTGQIMIHNASMQGDSGDYRIHEKTAAFLKHTNSIIANAYALKTGLSKEDILELMDNETWLGPEDAKSYGFIDEILFTVDDYQMVAATTEMIPLAVINKLNHTKWQNEIDLLEMKGVTL